MITNCCYEQCKIKQRADTLWVQQGSILGPLLFIVFYNDFADHLTYCDVIIYADDTVVFIADKNVQNIEMKLNKDLEKISAYFHLDELIINLKKGKTEVMLFGSSQRLKMGGNHLNVMYEGNKINFLAQYKYLGMVIDNHLNLNENFDRAYKRASTCLRLLERLRPYLTLDATIKVYVAMIIPLMTYSSTIRIPCTNTQCKKLQSLDHHANSVIKSNVTPIGSLLNRDICMLVKKCLLKKFYLDT